MAKRATKNTSVDLFEDEADADIPLGEDNFEKWMADMLSGPDESYDF